MSARKLLTTGFRWPITDRRWWAAAALVAALACAGLGLYASGAGANGCTKTWSGVTAAWGTAADWSPAGVPAATDDVCITASGSYTVTLTAGAAVKSLTLGAAGDTGTQTLDVQGTPAGGTSTLTLAAASTIAPGAELILDNTAGGDWADLAGASVTNDGTIQSRVEGSSNNFLEAPVVNNGDGQIDVLSGELRQDQATTTTNDGTITVSAGGAGVLAGALTLTNASAVLVNSGSLSNSGRVALSAGASFTQTAGALTGQPVAITAGTLSDTAGTGAFDLLGNSNLSGTIPAGQTVTVLGNASGTASTTLTGPVTNNGTLILDNTTGGDWASVTGATLTNNATIKSQVEGSSNNFLEAPVLNETTGNINILTGELRQDHATTTTNKGTITTNAAGVGTPAGALTLTNANATLTNDGSLVNNGSVSLSGGASWTQSVTVNGTPETGQPVAITAGTLSDTAGTGAFDLLGNSNLSGTIPAGQTVTVLGNASGTASTTLTGPVTNNGTLILDNTTGGDWASVTGATLTNNATIKSQVEGSSNNFLEAPVLNETTGNINILTGELRQDHATTTTNKGTITTNAAGVGTPAGALTLTNANATLTNDGSLVNNGSVSLSGGASWTNRSPSTAPRKPASRSRSPPAR